MAIDRFLPLAGAANAIGLASPMLPSGDYRAMEPYWFMIETMLEGTPAMRDAAETYLPRFPQEGLEDYGYRRKNAKFTNIYRDIVENLSAKPFTKEVQLKKGSSSTAIDGLIEDIDGQGNHLHVFSAQLFFQAINDAVAWIFVDKARVPEGATLADEKAMGVRPYWVMIPAKRMLAVFSDMVDGKETVVHARIWEPTLKREGYTEVEVNRVRELNRPRVADGVYGPATFILWEEQRESATSQRSVWVAIDQGAIALGVISLVPVITGRRKGTSWRFVPPMQDAAYLQIEHYQQETNLKNIKEQSAFPMLSGNGVTPEVDESGSPKAVPVGAKAVLYAPRNPDGGATGSWTFIEPSASSLTFLAADLKATEQNLRELGRQPLTAQTGNLTVITTAFAAQKGNSAIQAWCLNLKDALEQALKFTAQWLGDTAEPEVQVHTDFAIDVENAQAPDILLKMQAAHLISRKAALNEFKRRDILSPEYDAEADQTEIDNEQPADPTAQDVQNALGPPPALRVVPNP